MLRVTALVFFLITIGVPSKAQNKPFPNSEFAFVDSIQIHFRQWNNQAAKGNILFIHGFVSSTYSWRNNTQTLADSGYHVVAIDLPSFGFSGRPTGFDHSPEHLSQLVLHFLQKNFPQEKWNIVGHSSSGSIIAAMCLQNQAIINSATIVNGTVQDISSSIFYDAVFGFMRIGLIRESLGLLYSWQLFHEDVFTDFLSFAYLKKPSLEVVENYVKPYDNWTNKRHVFDLFKISHNISVDEFYEKLPEINLIWGRLDPWTSLVVAKRLIRRTGKGKLYLIKKAGHTPMETHPEAFNQYLLEIIKAH